MKKQILRFVALCFAIVFLSSSNIIFAKEYIEKIVNEDFASAKESEFLPPGDIDKNGKLDATDLSQLRRQLFNDSEYSIYSDVNGDNEVNIIDLVRQKKNSVQIKDFVGEGAMFLNGNSVCNSKYLSKLGTGATYEVSYSYKSDSPINVKINGLGDEIIFESEASSNSKTVNYNFKTPLNISDYSKITLSVTGTGVIENFYVTRINMDNELVENW